MQFEIKTTTTTITIHILNMQLYISFEILVSKFTKFNQ